MKISTTKRTFHPIKGEIPSPLDPPSGCHFHPRCKHATELCRKVYPKWMEVDAQRGVACHLYDPASGMSPKP